MIQKLKLNFLMSRERIFGRQGRVLNLIWIALKKKLPENQHSLTEFFLRGY
jgi:hypothetical protein